MCCAAATTRRPCFFFAGVKARLHEILIKFLSCVRTLRARQEIRCAFWRERRAGRCEAPRRRRCRCASSRSGNKADARPPPRPSGLRPAAKCTPYFLTGPKTRKRKESRSFGCGRAVPCSSVVFIHTRPKLRGARGGSRFFSRCRGLLRAVENLIRVNSWNSWPKKAATNFTKNDHCPLDVIGLKCNFSRLFARAD